MIDHCCSFLRAPEHQYNAVMRDSVGEGPEKMRREMIFAPQQKEASGSAGCCDPQSSDKPDSPKDGE
jgi:hypothetical protein